VLSALGLAAAAERVELAASLHQRADAPERDRVLTAYAQLEARAAGTLPGAVTRRLADCRFAGQGYEITVPLTNGELDSIPAAFHALHRARYGHLGAGGAVEIVNVRVVAERAGGRPVWGRRLGSGRPTPAWRKLFVHGREVRAQIWPLGELPPRLRITGPAVLAGPDATALVEPGWRATVHASGAVILERT
jgi:N-methylhydantoinase A/oxoprolinase/acetone carboxylase beta subunit